MRSASKIASSTSFVTSTTVVRRAFQIASSSSWSRARVSASSALNGSSINRTLGRMASPRATATRWRIPPDSSRGRLAAAAVRPTSATSSSVRRRRSALGSAPSTASTASAMFSRVVIHGSSEYCWKTMPRSGPGSLTASPSSTIVPASGASRPAISEISVVLPEPE